MKKEVKINLFSYMEFGWMQTGEFYVALTNANIDLTIANEAAHETMRFARTMYPDIKPEFKNHGSGM